MSLIEKQPLSHVREEIPTIIRKATRYVRVDEYVRIRNFNKGISSDERKQIYLGATVIAQQEEREGRTYRLRDKIHFTLDPPVFSARLILRMVPLSTYLAARHELLEAQKPELDRRGVYELLGDSRVADLNLTNKVIAATTINLSSII